MPRVLIWSPNYAPEPTGIPPLVTDAAEWFADRGHSVEVVAPVPNYPERRIHSEYRGKMWVKEERSGVTVQRHWLRVRERERFVDKALYEFSSATAALPHVLRRLGGVDVVVCLVPTLTAAAYAAAICRRTRLVLWVQDLVLNAAKSLDAGRVGRAALSSAGFIERFAVSQADRVVVCSPGFAEHFKACGADPAKIRLVYNWADIDWITPRMRPAYGEGTSCHDVTRFLYAGNLGYTHGFETLVDAARMVGHTARVHIVGSGNAADEVVRLARSVENVEISPPVEREAFPGLLRSADVHLLVQRRVSAGANLPSKIATYMASGKPILAAIDAAAPAAALLRQSGGAVLVEPEEPAELAKAMRRLADDPVWRDELGARGRAFAEQHLAKDSSLARLERAFFG